jgi:hypothetical protein
MHWRQSYFILKNVQKKKTKYIMLIGWSFMLQVDNFNTFVNGLPYLISEEKNTNTRTHWKIWENPLYEKKKNVFLLYWLSVSIWTSV